MLRDLFKRLVGAGGAPQCGGALAAQLRDYPPWHVPHLGTNSAYPGSAAQKLDEAEMRDNLHAYVAAIPARTALLGRLLAEFDIDSADSYTDAMRPRFIRALHLMLVREMPALYRPALHEYLSWESSSRLGPEIVFSLLGDIAMLFADVLRAAKPGCFVGMNLDPADREITSYGRPCVLGLSDGFFPGTHQVFDFEDEMFGVYRRMKDTEISFADEAHVDNDVGSALIGNTVLEACTRFVVEPDLPERRASTWMARAV